MASSMTLSNFGTSKRFVFGSLKSDSIFTFNLCLIWSLINCIDQQVLSKSPVAGPNGLQNMGMKRVYEEEEWSQDSVFITQCDEAKRKGSKRLKKTAKVAQMSEAKMKQLNEAVEKRCVVGWENIKKLKPRRVLLKDCLSLLCC